MNLWVKSFIFVQETLIVFIPFLDYSSLLQIQKVGGSGYLTFPYTSWLRVFSMYLYKCTLEVLNKKSLKL